MANDIVKHDTGLMPALSLEQMGNRYNQIAQLTKDVMKQDIHYGTIPGTDKPTLLKPGAEMLCSMFGLSPRFTIQERLEDWERGIFYNWYKCSLYSGAVIVAEGEGSCNSKEKKYRYRTVFENKASEEEKEAGRLETPNSKNGKPNKVYVIENTEPFDLINTFQKMAQKRALIAASLIAVNASAFFTQDMEDFVDVPFTPAKEEEVAAAAPKATNEPARVSSTPAPWQRWTSSEDAILWADDQVDEDGVKLFNATKHTENSYAKAKREHAKSLAKDAKQTARDFWKYWFEKVEARKRGEEYVLPTHGSQRIFEEPIGEDEGLAHLN